jgi:hypothetical protein
MLAGVCCISHVAGCMLTGACCISHVARCATCAEQRRAARALGMPRATYAYGAAQPTPMPQGTRAARARATCAYDWNRLQRAGVVRHEPLHAHRPQHADKPGGLARCHAAAAELRLRHRLALRRVHGRLAPTRLRLLIDRHSIRVCGPRRVCAATHCAATVRDRTVL